MGIGVALQATLPLASVRAARYIKSSADWTKGMWATAPSLRNGPVATPADLLKPATERATAFDAGSASDIVNVGLAVNQPKLKATITTTDCSKRDFGSSRCGHEFGTTTLSVEEQRTLLEYLKAL